MDFSAIYIDENGKSQVLDDPAKPGTIPQAVIDVLKKYKLCKIEFDKDHPGGDGQKKIDEFDKSNKEKIAEKLRLEKLLKELNKKYSYAKINADLKKAQDECDEAKSKTDKAINNGDAPYTNLNPKEKTQAHEKAKEDHRKCYEAATAAHKLAKAPIDKQKGEDKDIKAAEAALKALSIPDIPLSCNKTDDCTKDCRICVILFLNKEEIVVKDYSSARVFEDKYLYFCTCSEFTRDLYKILKDGSVEKVKDENKDKKDE